MNAKSSTRLRLECLETRSLLSAIGLPFVPPVALPPAAALGELFRIGGHQVDRVIIQDAVQNAAAMPSTDPTLTPDRLSPELGGPLHTAIIFNANPTLTPDRLSPRPGDPSHTEAVFIANPTLAPQPLSPVVTEPSYEPPATIGRLSEQSPAHEFHSTGDPTNSSSALLDSTLDARNGLAGSVSAAPSHDLPHAQSLDLTRGQVDDATTIITIDSSAVVLGQEMARRDAPPSHGVVVQQSVMVVFMVHAPAQLRSPDEAAPDDPAAVVPADLPLVVNDVGPGFDALPVGRGPTVLRGPMGRAADQAVSPIVEYDISSSVEVSTPQVKGHAPDVLAASDPGRVGEQTFVAVETPLPASHGVANPPTTLAALADTTISNSTEGGFITLDDASATTPRPGNASNNTGFKVLEGGDQDRGNWLTDILPDVRKPVDSGRRSDNAPRSGEKLAAEVSLREAPVNLPPAAEAEEGGSIELAIAAPSPGAASDDSLPAGESAVGNAAQQLAEIRPESGVGLFCDIEVAVAPTSPSGDSASVSMPDPNAQSFVAAAGIHGWKASPTAGLVPPFAKSSQPIMARLADYLPLLLGITIFVSRGGLRLEEEVPERERRFRAIEGLRQAGS